MKYVYHPEILARCPPVEAEPANQTIFRSVRQNPPVGADFDSDVEVKKASKDNCQCWGCSVWPTLDAAKHGRSVLPYLKKRYVVAGDLKPTDGQLMLTPTPDQPLHTTFWKVHRLDVSPRFKVVLAPNE